MATPFHPTFFSYVPFILFCWQQWCQNRFIMSSPYPKPYTLTNCQICYPLMIRIHENPRSLFPSLNCFFSPAWKVSTHQVDHCAVLMHKQSSNVCVHDTYKLEYFCQISKYSHVTVVSSNLPLYRIEENSQCDC